jgi:hypothetical protein
MCQFAIQDDKMMGCALTIQFPVRVGKVREPNNNAD